MSLYRNDGDGTFVEVSREAGLTKVKGSYFMTSVVADFNEDGWPDIYVACDSTPSYLLRNNGDGTFTDIGLESGVALNEDSNEQAGMGVGIGDDNVDGHLDIFKTNSPTTPTFAVEPSPAPPSHIGVKCGCTAGRAGRRQ